MIRAQLISEIRSKKSFLCVGLDTDINKIPRHLLEFDDPIFEFNKQIIDATLPYAVAYKPNVAFYEARGEEGWRSLQKTVAYLPDSVFKIADAKRGDIGNTSAMYARAFFEEMNFDAITVTPYMGKDSVTPFLGFEGKWVIVLAATSNPGFYDFEDLELKSGERVYERVIQKSSEWGTPENLMYVVGATRPKQLANIRKKIPDHFILVPGVGTQEGNLDEVSAVGLNKECGLLVNSARSIIYKSSSEDFAEVASKEAHKIQQQMCDEIE